MQTVVLQGAGAKPSLFRPNLKTIKVKLRPKSVILKISYKQAPSFLKFRIRHLQATDIICESEQSIRSP